jgi:hypothetical protein
VNCAFDKGAPRKELTRGVDTARAARAGQSMDLSCRAAATTTVGVAINNW